MILDLNHITLAVKDIEKSFIFYREIIGLKPLCRWDKGAYFLAGKFWFCLNYDEHRQANLCYTHYAFTVCQTEFDAMSQRIIDSGTTIFKDNTSPGDSLYFYDPDQHKLEIHAGNWQTRIAAKKIDPGAWKNIAWFV